MSNKRCPHLVRHGRIGKDDIIEFVNVCAMKRTDMGPCTLEKDGINDYRKCPMYITLFSPSDKKNVRLNETNDIESKFVTEAGNISDMELL